MYALDYSKNCIQATDKFEKLVRRELVHIPYKLHEKILSLSNWCLIEDKQPLNDFYIQSSDLMEGYSFEIENLIQIEKNFKSKVYFEIRNQKADGKKMYKGLMKPLKLNFTYDIWEDQKTQNSVNNTQIICPEESIEMAQKWTLKSLGEAKVQNFIYVFKDPGKQKIMRNFLNRLIDNTLNLSYEFQISAGMTKKLILSLGEYDVTLSSPVDQVIYLQKKITINKPTEKIREYVP